MSAVDPLKQLLEQLVIYLWVIRVYVVIECVNTAHSIVVFFRTKKQYCSGETNTKRIWNGVLPMFSMCLVVAVCDPKKYGIELGVLFACVVLCHYLQNLEHSIPSSEDRDPTTVWKEGDADPNFPERIESIVCDCLTENMLQEMPNVKHVVAGNVRSVSMKHRLEFARILKRKENEPLPNARKVVVMGSFWGMVEHIKRAQIEELLLLNSDLTKVPLNAKMKAALKPAE